MTGYFIEKLENKPFAALEKGIMLTIYDKEFSANTVELGEAPAGCMCSTVKDLSLFICVLLRDGDGKSKRILKAEALEEMRTPQFIDPNSKSSPKSAF